MSTAFASATLPPASPFDFSQAMRYLCEDICSRLPEFIHIKMGRVAVTFAQARRQSLHGLQANLTPLRFLNGQLITYRCGRQWTIQRFFDKEVEILYILTFYLPRFLNQTFHEKMITVMHELYHISPQFDGDIRRLPGQCCVHSRSQKEYDRRMALLVDDYFALSPPPHLCRFLWSNFQELHDQFGGIVGTQLPRPRMVPLAEVC